MPQNRLERKLGDVEYSSGQVSEFELPRSHYYQRLNLLVDYDVDVNTADTPKSANGILELIDRIEVVLNGNQTLKSYSFAEGHFIDKYQYATRPVFDAVDYSSATNQTGRMQTFVDFNINPGDNSAMLPSFKLSDLVLRIKWGTDADIADDVTVNSATCKVLSKERLRKSVATSNSKEQRVLNNLMAFKEREVVKSINANGVNTVELPRGNVYYAAPFQVINDDTPDNSLVGEFEVVEDGVETHRTTDFDLARSQDKQEYNVQRLTDGFAYVNFGHRGNLQDVIGTESMDSFELQLDTDGTAPSAPSNVRLVTQEIIR